VIRWRASLLRVVTAYGRDGMETGWVPEFCARFELETDAFATEG
jgi:hypothetical protein